MENKIRLIDATATIETLAANFRQNSVDGCDNPFYQIAEDTNADHLQELTDEEKAHLLTQVFYQAAQQTNAEHYILEWLRKPVEKDEL